MGKSNEHVVEENEPGVVVETELTLEVNEPREVVKTEQRVEEIGLLLVVVDGLGHQQEICWKDRV